MGVKSKKVKVEAKVVSGAARDRWMAASLRAMTPTSVQAILDAVFAGSLTAQWELFDLMEGSWARLSKNANEVKDAVVGQDWMVQPWAPRGGAPTPEAVRRATVLDGALFSMRANAALLELDFEGTVKGILDAWLKGFCLLEVDWEARDGVWAPKCARWVHPRYYGFPTNENVLRLNGQEIAIANGGQGMGSGLWIEIPEDKFLVSIYSVKAGHPCSGAMLRALAPWWCYSNFATEWLVSFAQIYGVPIRWATYDSSNAALLTDLCGMLENLGSSGWGAFPTGTTLELKEAAKSGADNPQAFIHELAQKECDIRLLGQTLTTEAGDKGTQALGTVHQSVRGQVIAAASKFACQVLQQLARAFCRLNFGDERECPWIVAASEQAKDAESLARRDVMLLNAGVRLPAGWFYERHEIPMPEDDEDLVGRAAGNDVGIGADGAADPQRDGEDKGQDGQDGRDGGDKPQRDGGDEAAEGKSSGEKSVKGENGVKGEKSVKGENGVKGESGARLYGLAQGEDLGPLWRRLERVFEIERPEDRLQAAEALLSDYPELARQCLRGRRLATVMERSVQQNLIDGIKKGVEERR